MADAGIECSSVQTAFVGSCEVSNPDAIVGWLGLEGIPVLGVFSGAVWLGEVVHWQDWAAVVLMVVAIAAVLAPARSR